MAAVLLWLGSSTASELSVLNTWWNYWKVVKNFRTQLVWRVGCSLEGYTGHCPPQLPGYHWHDVLPSVYGPEGLSQAAVNGNQESVQSSSFRVGLSQVCIVSAAECWLTQLTSYTDIISGCSDSPKHAASGLRDWKD